ncbi:MAG: hypothetical protein U5L00_05225 [Desulfovermiculus sp.]|nr:hypothetical protein [Desulfovermiculus sp.]
MGELIDGTCPTVSIAVDFFDDKERDKLSTYKTYTRIQELVQDGVHISTAQFLTYYLFHKKRPGKPSYRNYSELGLRTSRAAADLEDWVYHQDGTLVSAHDADPQDSAIIERIGEATALSVVGQVHDLHEADWDHMPEHRGRGGIPIFDYEHEVNIASDGNITVQVEAKGTHLGKSSGITKNVQAQKKKIDKKKAKIEYNEKINRYPYLVDIRYGVISAIGSKAPLQCWLTDPPAGDEGDSRRYRLMARLHFILDWISFLKPRSPFTASLTTLLSALEQLADPFELSSNPLLNANGEEFFVEGLDLFGEVPPILANMSRVTDGPTVGTVIQSTEGRLFFVGVQSSLFRMAATQDFESILTYRDLGGVVWKNRSLQSTSRPCKTHGTRSLRHR